MRRLLSVLAALALATVPMAGGAATQVAHGPAAPLALQAASPSDATAHGGHGGESAAPCCTLAVNGCLGWLTAPESRAVPRPISLPSGRMFGSAYAGRGIDPESDTPPPRA